MYFNIYVYKDVILYVKNTHKMIEVGIEPTTHKCSAS